MLPTTKFFIAEMSILILLAAIQVFGTISLLKMSNHAFPRFKKSTNATIIAGVLAIHAPFFYWMLLYKNVSVTFSTAEWNILWVLCFIGGSGIFTVGISSLLKKITFKGFKNIPFKNTVNTSFKTTFLKEETLQENSVIIPAFKEIKIAPKPMSTHRRNFLKTTAIAAAGTLVSGSVLKAAETDDLIIEEATLRIRNLAPEHEGLTIGMMSDIHSSPFMLRDEMEFFRKKLEGLKTDLIFLPGDFVNSQTREVYPFAEAFAGITAPYGVFGVTGNHDYFSRQIEVVAKEVEQSGIKLIRNGNIAVDVKGAKLHLLGIDDPDSMTIGDYLQTGKSPEQVIESVLKGIPSDAPKILLCHKPYYFEGYAKVGIDLVLAGHTHGGQVVLAKFDDSNLSFAGIVSEYIAGTYHSKRNPNSTMYVGRGVGSVGIPFRVNCPPEITKITLTRA
ncbi:MAG: metallophosphoesterase [Bacteroidota bacterium]